MPRYVPYGEALQSPEVSIKWGKVKSTHRAIEKLVRVYEQVNTCAPNHGV